MPARVIMPALELAQDSGKVLQWLRAPGDTVRKGDPLLEIETDKATVEIEAPASSSTSLLHRGSSLGRNVPSAACGGAWPSA